MPTSRPRKRQDQPELVELIPGVSIPRHFVRTVVTESGSWTVEIATDPVTKKPRWLSRSEHVGDGEPVEEAGEPWRRRMEDAIAHQAGTIAMSRFTADKGWAISPDFENYFPEVAVPADAPRIDPSAVRAVEDGSRHAVRPKPGRRPVSDAEKLEVLELYRTMTVADIVEMKGKKERTIRRWIADAKKLEQQGGGR
jgi:hypothetical protein